MAGAVGCTTVRDNSSLLNGAELTTEQVASKSQQTSSATQLSPDVEKDYRSFSLIDVERENGLFATSTSTLLQIITIKRGASEEDIKFVLNKALEEAKKDPWLDTQPNHKIVIRCYNSAEQYRTNGQIVATVAQYPSKDQPEITIRKDLLEAAAQPGETRLGFSEYERRTIFADISIAESRAYKEADARYKPPLGQVWTEEGLQRWNDMVDRRIDQYKAEVVRKYGISKESLSEIGSEGVSKNWPMPEWDDNSQE